MTLKVVAKYVRVTDREAMDKSYERYVSREQVAKSTISAATGIETVQKTMDVPRGQIDEVRRSR